MDFENENKEVKGTSSEQDANREGYRPDFRQAGRSPRPRINTSEQGGYQRPSYNRNRDDEGGFRPEGFGQGLQGQGSQRSYRPRNNYGEQREGGYQQRPRYNREGGYGQRPQGGYRPRYNNEGDSSSNYGEQREGGYQPRQHYDRNQNWQPRERREGGYQQREGGYQPRQSGDWQPRERREGGYQSRKGGGYQQRGYGNRQQGGYQQRGYGNRPQGGYRQHSDDYDPNAKYSQKKRIEYKEQNYDPNEPIRLNKYLANAGQCSRREADDFIQAGVVTVNGEVVTELGTKVLRTDEVRFHGEPVTLEKKVYVLLNKPKDYVTTSDDPQQRKTVMDLVKDASTERIYPVGRLDRNTTGVLLLTNDGDMASKLTHPKYLKTKIYHVYLDHNVTLHDMQQISEGLTLEDGEVKVDDIQYADPIDKKQVGIEIHSGKNRIVRRIFESLGYKVVKLDRVQFAGLTKKNLRRGDWRYLTEEEVDRLRMGAYK